MKTFRMIGMALVAVLISMSLVSCDDDDDDDYSDPDPQPHDPTAIVNTRWEIQSCNENDFTYGAGDYLDFYNDGTGKFFNNSEESDFVYTEVSQLTIQLEFADGSVMCGEWNYTDDQGYYVDFEYYWAGQTIDYTMKLKFVEDL